MDTRQPIEAGARPDAYEYEAFGLSLRSELPIPELRRTTLEPAVRIRLARLGITAPPDADAREWSLVEDGAAYLGWEGVGTFRISEASEIALDPDPNATPERIRLFLLGAALGTLLHQRGYLVLHGSAVAIDGGTVAFLGPKRCGKSTSAAALYARGHHFVTDDVMAVDMAGPTPIVQPGYPQLKLWPDSLSVIGEGASDLPRLHPQLEKRDYRVSLRFADRPLPLRCIYVLDHASQPGVEALERGTALSELIAHWYCGRFGYETLEGLGISCPFLWSTRLVGRVPFYRLGRPRSLAALSEVADIVEAGARNALLDHPPADANVRQSESQAG